jgi:hypothetical protein
LAIAGADSFNNAGTMNSPSTDNADLVRGLLIALGLIVLCAGAFLLVARNGHSHEPDIIDRVLTIMTPPEPKPEKKKPAPAAGAAGAANPAAAGGAPASADGGPGTPSGPDSSAGNAAGLRPVAHTAAQALRQVLQDYRDDPKRTTTITISSTGRISQAKPGPLTAHDGLPMSALKGSTVLTGAVPTNGAAR